MAKRAEPAERLRPAACSRRLVDQLRGPYVARRGEHPKASVRRLELLTDAELDELRERRPDGSALALAMLDALDERFDASLVAAGLSDDLVRRRLTRKPILAVWVCVACGAADVGRAERSWSVDDAMRRACLGEREVLAIERLMSEAYRASPPSLDALSGAALHELAELVDADVDLDALRSRIETLIRCVRDVAEAHRVVVS